MQSFDTDSLREYAKTEGLSWAKAAADYARYRPGFQPAMYDRLKNWYNIPRPGDRVLDLGTGTGTIARSLSLRGYEVEGLDPDLGMLEKAKALDAEAGLQRPITYHVGKAESTGLPSASFDCIFAGQCWHWFEHNAALTEIERILKPSKKLVICHFDWLPVPGSAAELTERVIATFNQKWTAFNGNGFYPQWTSQLAARGWKNIETFSFDADIPYTHEAWRGRIRASSAISTVLSAEAVEKFDAELARLLKERFPSPTLYVTHRTFVVIATHPSSA